MGRDNVEIVRRLQELFQAGAERGDFGAIQGSGLVAEEFELCPAPELDAQRYRGYEEFERFLIASTEDFESWSSRLERVVEAPDDRVVGFLHQSGVGKGSGAPVDLRYGAVYELKEGRVVRISLYLDPSQALAAAGLSA